MKKAITVILSFLVIIPIAKAGNGKHTGTNAPIGPTAANALAAEEELTRALLERPMQYLPTWHDAYPRQIQAKSFRDSQGRSTLLFHKYESFYMGGC
jgi:hypothetical protein